MSTKMSTKEIDAEIDARRDEIKSIMGVIQISGQATRGERKRLRQLGHEVTVLRRMRQAS